MPSTVLPPISEDELDDILYFARVGDLTEFKGAIEGSAKRFNVSPHAILLAAVEEISGNGSLHMASANGHVEILTYALSLLPSQSANSILTLQNASGNTPLHWAALNGHIEAVKLLVQAGADPSATNKAGHDSVYEAEVNRKEKVVEWLLTEGKGLDAGVSGSSGDGAGEMSGIDELQEEVENMSLGGKTA